MNPTLLALRCDPCDFIPALKPLDKVTSNQAAAPRDAVKELSRSIQRMPEENPKGGSMVRLETALFSQLELLARSRGISTAEALHQLVDTGTSHLKRNPPRSLPLSPKQTEVLECLNAGFSVKEIGVHMDIKEGTVRTHILRLRVSLDCSDLLSLRFQ